MVETRRFEAGETVVVRHIHGGVIHYAQPVTVVRDTPERIVWYTQPGSRYHTLGTEAGEVTRDWRLAVRPMQVEWTVNRKVDIVTPGAAHAVDAYWRDDRFLGWYINLQEPLRRTPIGFDTMDHVLDVQVAADLKLWRWKDEDELQDWLDGGLLTPEQSAAIRAEGERALAAALAGEPPYNEGWHLWQPEPGWGIPAFPEGWEAVPLDGWGSA